MATVCNATKWGRSSARRKDHLRGKEDQRRDNVWTWTGIDAAWKLMISFRLGDPLSARRRISCKILRDGWKTHPTDDGRPWGLSRSRGKRVQKNIDAGQDLPFH